MRSKFKKMEPKVIILLGTYNGEKFIEKQLESIVKQTFSDWQLVIRDDCSTDHTIEIVKAYIEKDPRITLICGTDNLGQVKNYAALTEIDTGDSYVMFSDQDDYWKNDKIEKTYVAMKETETKYPNAPVMVYTDKEMVDQDLKSLGIRDKIMKHDFFFFLCQNPVYGCTTMLNPQLKSMMTPYPEYATCHDYWAALLAASRGKIVRLPYESIMYRQHSGNVTGGMNNYSLTAKLKHMKKINKRIREGIMQNYLFCKEYGHDIEEAEKYIKLIETPVILRGFKALSMSYKLDNKLATFRNLMVLSLSRFEKK